jgi:hypothetical protein
MFLFLHGDNKRCKYLHVTAGSRREFLPVSHVIVAVFGHSIGPTELRTTTQHSRNSLTYYCPVIIEMGSRMNYHIPSSGEQLQLASTRGKLIPEARDAVLNQQIPNS